MTRSSGDASEDPEVAIDVIGFRKDRKNATRRLHPALGLLALVPYLLGIFLT